MGRRRAPSVRMRSSYGFLTVPRTGSRDAERPNAGRCCTRSRCRCCARYRCRASEGASQDMRRRATCHGAVRFSVPASSPRSSSGRRWNRSKPGIRIALFAASPLILPYDVTKGERHREPRAGVNPQIRGFRERRHEVRTHDLGFRSRAIGVRWGAAYRTRWKFNLSLYAWCSIGIPWKSEWILSREVFCED